VLKAGTITDESNFSTPSSKPLLAAFITPKLTSFCTFDALIALVLETLKK
jgi:hypothetical protein